MVQSSISLEQIFSEPPKERSHSGCGSCGSGGSGERCGNGLEKIYPTTAVRFGYMRYIGEFSHAADMKFTCGARVVISTRRGVEIGEQVSLTCTGCDKSVTRDQMKSWVETCGEDSFIFDAGRILREATSTDLAEYAHIQDDNRNRRAFCQNLAKKAGLNLKVLECESTFGGERIIFYFTSEDRVDFRGLVKELAHEYRTRIEMRQIGARDEARLLADFETCGREVCCKVFLKTLRPITMRMAKLQKATLDPSQVSGRCGRLKCCLRYEHESYEELDKKLPKVGIRIRTNHGEGVVVNRQILTQLVQIRIEGDKLITVVAEDITAVGVPPPAVVPSAERTAERPATTGRGRPSTGPRPAPDRPKPRREVAEPSKEIKPAVDPESEVNDQSPPNAPAQEEPGRRSRRRGRSGRGRGPAPGGPDAPPSEQGS